MPMAQLRDIADELSATRIPQSAIGDALRTEMFRLMQRYYANVCAARFAEDLAAKTCALVLRDRHGLAGFTTLRVFDFEHGGRTRRIVFSGDTIVDHRHWGEQELARCWLGEIGRITRAGPDVPLYWFLIVKGHRTYRYLPAFARDYVPRAEQRGGDAALVAMRNALAAHLYPGAFDAQTGLIRFAEARGNLQADWSEPSAREAALPDVAYFLSANPGYRSGDELACLCSLARGNMRPRAQRWFDADWALG